MSIAEIGRFLLVAGVAVTAVGIVFILFDKLPIGQLPGDIEFGSGRFRVFFPLSTCILVSVVLTLVINFFSK